MPGSDSTFAATYDPARARPPHRTGHAIQRPQYLGQPPPRPQRLPPRQDQRPMEVSHQPRPIYQQPQAAVPMSAAPRKGPEMQTRRFPVVQNVSSQPKRPQIVHNSPAAGRKPVIQTIQTQTTHQSPARKAIIQSAPVHIAKPQVARIVRRDSNGISDCSDSEDDSNDHSTWRRHNVSPVQASPKAMGSGGQLYAQMGMSYAGRNGKL
ncbi:hypothetical protein F5Y16DRAFT_385106 [Xylariaceae sp. FL0255]|nr:hypothetical protein F5Y16DRAFT_385106 [Xylariaceae sp. FL0255]